jgi:hypothetical protein
LSNLVAATRKRKDGRTIKISIGPVGAAKILFALRQEFFPPWDNKIIEHFNFTKDSQGYFEYLIKLKSDLEKLRDSCKKSEVQFDKLPQILKRPKTTLTKLADEYWFISLTRACVPSEIIKRSRNAS